MKKILVFVLSAFVLLSCGDDTQSDENDRIVSDSSGNINQVAVVMENELWEGEIGEALRDELAAPVDGLPQEEPLFSLSQIPPQSFSGFVRKNRLFVKVEKNEPSDFEVVKEVYARPQTGIIISGGSNEEIISTIKEESENIVSTLKKTEKTEKRRRMNKSLKNDAVLEEKFGLSLKFPSAYRYAVEEEDFVWLRKDIRKGNMEILIYEVPMEALDRDTTIVGNIIKMRDSIGRTHIPGPVEGSYMITEEAYAPYLFRSQIDGKFAYETKGTWEVKNAFMAGPFVNYAVRDEENNRYLILEGFVFSPSTGKRDYIFELEAILEGAKIE